jgi:hypothetical protein
MRESVGGTRWLSLIPRDIDDPIRRDVESGIARERRVPEICWVSLLVRIGANDPAVRMLAP